MRNKIWLILATLYGLIGSYAYAQTTNVNAQATTDSINAATINKEAESPDFIHAYIIDITPGKAFYSTFGHAAIRLKCPSKKLDYCFSFEMDMSKSTKLDVFRRTAKAGYGMMPSQEFINSYKQEGRGVIAYELNLSPKEKQNLWKFLDKSTSNGSNWTFNYTSVNCLSMVLYAINSAIMPNQIEYQYLPSITKADFSSWEDYTTCRSPWVNILFHTFLPDDEGEHMSPEDRLTPEMLHEVLPKAIIKDSIGKNARNLIMGSPTILVHKIYEDEPCWFKPWMAVGMTIVLLIGIVGILLINKKHKKE